MAHAGQELDNPVTGERIIFRETSADTGGELFRFELFMKPGGFVPAEHLHPNQEERFEVISGRPRFSLAGDVRDAGDGDVLVAPPDMEHVFWNPGAESAHLIIELRPALASERLFETIWGLASEGKLASNGLPRNPFQLAVIGEEFREEVRPVGPVLRALDLLTPAAASVGRLLGYRIR
ncbi:MAG: cupin domain-containing protein [Actinomycetota bacterium]